LKTVIIDKLGNYFEQNKDSTVYSSLIHEYNWYITGEKRDMKNELGKHFNMGILAIFKPKE
jgi:hypothetical protein